MKGTTTFAFICMLLLSTACSKPVPQSLPADWPIPELTLPDQAVITKPVRGGQDTGIIGGGKLWVVKFDCPDDIALVASHLESGLAEAGYSQVVDPDGTANSPIGREYYSQDHRLQVKLLGGNLETGEKALNSDFVLMLTSTSEPQEIPLVSQGKAKLVPLQ